LPIRVRDLARNRSQWCSTSSSGWDAATRWLGAWLYISRRLARAMGGDLSVERAETGARFVLVVPAD
jgi:hypothetical protein